MAGEVFPDDDSDGHEGYVTEERAKEAFVAGAQACREMMARFVATESPTIANSIRANWHPGWGSDPGKLDGDIPIDPWS
jgi:hypothetical protein